MMICLTKCLIHFPRNYFELILTRRVCHKGIHDSWISRLIEINAIMRDEFIKITMQIQRRMKLKKEECMENQEKPEIATAKRKCQFHICLKANSTAFSLSENPKSMVFSEHQNLFQVSHPYVVSTSGS